MLPRYHLSSGIRPTTSDRRRSGRLSAASGDAYGIPIGVTARGRVRRCSGLPGRTPLPALLEPCPAYCFPSSPACCVRLRIDKSLSDRSLRGTYPSGFCPDGVTATLRPPAPLGPTGPCGGRGTLGALPHIELTRDCTILGVGLSTPGWSEEPSRRRLTPSGAPRGPPLPNPCRRWPRRAGRSP